MVAKPGAVLSPPASACCEPGPWQDSQPTWSATTAPSMAARACGLFWNASHCSWWHCWQVSPPTYLDSGWDRSTRAPPRDSADAHSRVRKKTSDRFMSNLLPGRLLPGGPGESVGCDPESTAQRCCVIVALAKQIARERGY